VNAGYVRNRRDEYISPYAPPVVILYYSCVYVGHNLLGLSAHIVVV